MRLEYVLLADQTVKDVQTHKLYILGLFDSISVGPEVELPVGHGRMDVAVGLICGPEEVEERLKFSVVVIDPEERLLFEQDVDGPMPRPAFQSRIDMALPIVGVQFYSFGPHRVEVRFGEEVMTARFDVRRWERLARSTNE